MSMALVLGAGASGLAAAWALRREGVEPKVLEAAERPGGKIRTGGRDGFRYELGPNAIQGAPELLELVRAAGLESDLVAASSELVKRFVVHDGKLVALPMGPKEAWSTPLLSHGALARILTEPFRSRGPGPHESVTRFVERRLGKEPARLIDAVVLGIFAGDPGELAMGYAFPKVYRLEAEHGSLLLGAIKSRRAARRASAEGGAPAPDVEVPKLVSFQRGLSGLVEGLATPLDVAYRHQVEEVRASDDGFLVRGRSHDGPFELRAERLISALPVHVAARILAPLGSTEPFLRIPHSTLAVVNLGLRRDQVRHPLDGFGFLAPHHEGREILGAIFASTLFPGRAPEGHAVVTVMAGGRRRPEIVELSDRELLRHVTYELEQLLGLEGEPVLAEVTRWQPGIPQASAVMGRVREAVAAMEEAHPRLTLLGDWLHGVGLPACIAAGWGVRP